MFYASDQAHDSFLKIAHVTGLGRSALRRVRSDARQRLDIGALRRAVARAEALGAYDSPDYQNAINAFYALYLFRHPVQADLDSSLASFNQAIYGYMQGPSEFTITGTLKDYVVTDSLSDVKVPTLLTVGEFDEVGPKLVQGFAERIPGARFEQLAGAAHMTTWDAPDAMIAAVRSFLRSADSVAVKASQ